MASYDMEYKVVKSKKSYTIADGVIKLCALKMATNFLGKEEPQMKLKLVPLSNNVIQSWIGDLSLDILDQVIS